MTGICVDDLGCSNFEAGGKYYYDKKEYSGDDEIFYYCKKICKKDERDSEEVRNLDLDNEFSALDLDLSKRQNEMSTTDQFVKDTTQLWRFERNKFIFLIICLILISLCALYMVYKNME